VFQIITTEEPCCKEERYLLHENKHPFSSPENTEKFSPNYKVIGWNM